MSFLENIKLIASELASMSPRTQLEIVKLCKELCIETKNYLVELDETTLSNITTRITNLESATTSLQNLYNALADELQTAEGNITANANAIETLQTSVQAITQALEGIYTKSQVDALLSAKADKLDTYTKTEINNALSGKASLSGNNTFSGTNTFNDTATFESDVVFNGETSIDNELHLDNPTKIYFNDDSKTLSTKLSEKQDVLTAGSGISIQNNVISATGGGGLYKHEIALDLYINYETSTYRMWFNIIDTNPNTYTITTLPNGYYALCRSDTDTPGWVNASNEHYTILDYINISIDNHKPYEVYFLAKNSQNDRIILEYLVENNTNTGFTIADSSIVDTVSQL